MSGLSTMSVLLSLLTILFLAIIFYINLSPSFLSGSSSEGFEDEKKDESLTKDPDAEIKKTIKKTLNDFTYNLDSELCSLFEKVRKTMMKNEKSSNPSLSESDIKKRVDDSINLKIPGSSLPCPLVKYPSDSESLLVWATWLSSLPDDFGARVVFMILFAQKTLSETEQNLKDALSGKKAPMEEAFTAICPPDVAAGKRKKQLSDSCELPENMKPEDLIKSIQQKLQTLESTKIKILKEKNISFSDSEVKSLFNQAIQSMNYLDEKQKETESGTLDVNPSDFA
jgi:hypothetical protein